MSDPIQRLIQFGVETVASFDERRVAAARAEVAEAIEREAAGGFPLSLCARYRRDYLRAKEAANRSVEVWERWSGNGPEDFDRGWYSASAGLDPETPVETDYCSGWNAFCTHQGRPRRRIGEDFADERLMRWLPAVRHEERTNDAQRVDGGAIVGSAAASGDDPAVARPRRKRTFPDLQRVMQPPAD